MTKLMLPGGLTEQQALSAGLLCAYTLGRPITVAGKAWHVPPQLGRELFGEAPIVEQSDEAANDGSGIEELPSASRRNLARRIAYYIGIAGEIIAAWGIEADAIAGAIARSTAAPAEPVAESQAGNNSDDRPTAPTSPDFPARTNGVSVREYFGSNSEPSIQSSPASASDGAVVPPRRMAVASEGFPLAAVPADGVTLLHASGGLGCPSGQSIADPDFPAAAGDGSPAQSAT